MGKSLVQLIEEWLPNSAAISHKAQTHHPGVWKQASYYEIFHKSKSAAQIDF